MTDENLLISFSAYLADQDRSHLTVLGYQTDLRQFMNWFEQTNGEPFALSSVTPADVREYRQQLIAVQQFKASTVNRHLAALAALMSWGKKTGQIEHDPTENVRGVLQVEHGPRSLDKKEQYALQRAIEKDLQLARMCYPKRWVSRQRDASLAIFLLHTGLRLHEALALRTDDIQLQERKGQVIVRQGKGGKSRTVPLNVAARMALQEWLSVRPENVGMFLWVGLENESPQALSGRSVQRALLRLGQVARLERLTPHVLRHSFAKNLIDSGVGLEKVAALLGHSNLNTTRIYITPSQKDLEQAVERLEEE